MNKEIHYRITCISNTMIHTITSLRTKTVSETFKEVAADKRKTSELKSIEFEPLKDNISEYTV